MSQEFFNIAFSILCFSDIPLNIKVNNEYQCRQISILCLTGEIIECWTFLVMYGVCICVHHYYYYYCKRYWKNNNEKEMQCIQIDNQTNGQSNELNVPFLQRKKKIHLIRFYIDQTKNIQILLQKNHRIKLWNAKNSVNSAFYFWFWLKNLHIVCRVSSYLYLSSILMRRVNTSFAWI